MIKHWSNDLELIDEEKCKWENATTAMIDEFDENKIKYMVRPVGAKHRVKAFVEENKGKVITGTIVIADQEFNLPNLKELLQEKIKVVKKNLEEYKNSLTQ
jgi:hypothetical protein